MTPARTSLQRGFRVWLACGVATVLPMIAPGASELPDTREMARRAEADLRGNLLPFWMATAPDQERGGFVGSVDHRGVADPAAPRGALLTSRILWTFSAAHRHWPDGGYLEMAQRARNDLLTRFWDTAHQGLRWSITADGAPLDPRKQTYGQAFGIYALSEYHRATGDAAALEHAIALYRLLESRVRDRTHGGYAEILSADWKPVRASAAAVMGRAGTKSQNTHLHVMEAFSNLMRVWPDEGLRKAQHALVDLMLSRVLDEHTWHLGLFFADDWTQVDAGVRSYGHDIEAAWLLTEAADLVGDPAQMARARRAAVEIARVTLAEGIDEDGALFYEGRASGPTVFRKDWWPQAEGIVGFLNAWQLSGDATHLEAAARLWQFVETHGIDRERGGWFNALSRERTPLPYPKIGFWKCPYHDGRAEMEMIDRLKAHTESLER